MERGYTEFETGWSVAGFILMVIILILGAAGTCHAQEVRITKPAAEYYLEIHDKYAILIKKDSLNETIIQNFTYTVRTKDLLIKSLTESNKNNGKIIEIKDEQIKLSEDQVKQLERKIKWLKVKTILIIGAETIIILLILI